MESSRTFLTRTSGIQEPTDRTHHLEEHIFDVGEFFTFNAATVFNPEDGDFQSHRKNTKLWHDGRRKDITPHRTPDQITQIVQREHADGWDPCSILKP